MVDYSSNSQLADWWVRIVYLFFVIGAAVHLLAYGQTPQEADMIWVKWPRTRPPPPNYSDRAEDQSELDKDKAYWCIIMSVYDK